MTLAQYFQRTDTPQPGSPVGRLMTRIQEEHPAMTFEAMRDEAHRLLRSAAKARNYRLPPVRSEVEKATALASLANLRASTPTEPTSIAA